MCHLCHKAYQQPENPRTMSGVNTRRIDTYRMQLRRTGAMKTDALVYLHERMTVEEEALNQLRDAASIDPGAIVVGTPDIHVGYGVPIGSVLGADEFNSQRPELPED